MSFDEAVIDGHLVTRVEQLLCDDATDIPRAACHEYLHRCPFPVPTWFAALPSGTHVV